jgi:hypothetical protein
MTDYTPAAAAPATLISRLEDHEQLRLPVKGRRWAPRVLTFGEAHDTGP